MKPAIDFYFDFGSPTSYLAWTQLPAIAAGAGADLHYHPVLLGGIFQATGNHSPAQIASKGAWMKLDLERFSKRYAVPFFDNPFFPINTLQLMRGAVGMQLRKPDSFPAYVATIYEGMWVDGLDLGKPEVLIKLLLDSDHDPREMQALTQDTEIKEKLRTDTEAAVARGVFGAPTIFVGNDMFFGQDRLDFVQESLSDFTLGSG